MHEAGAAYDDDLDPQGEVHDDGRVAWLDAHLRSARRAVDQGVDLRGFFVWSLLDNFEWAEGYRHRFGIVHVDHDTLARTPKASARWYRQVIAAGGVRRRRLIAAHGLGRVSRASTSASSRSGLRRAVFSDTSPSATRTTTMPATWTPVRGSSIHNAAPAADEHGDGQASAATRSAG